MRGLFGDEGCGRESLHVSVENGEGAGLPGVVDRHVGMHGGLAQQEEFFDLAWTTDGLRLQRALDVAFEAGAAGCRERERDGEDMEQPLAASCGLGEMMHLSFHYLYTMDFYV